MFGLSKKIKRPITCPIDEDKRIWMESSFLFLLNLFGKEETKKRRVLTPNAVHFPIRYDHSEKSAFETLQIIADQMEVPFNNIDLGFYDEKVQFLLEKSPEGIYYGKNEMDKFEILLSRGSLKEPERMVATLAHEVAHIKLLDDNNLDFNDEKLTDLTTVFFGLGVFNANEAFKNFKDSKTYGWNALGYLSQMEWGYALSLFAHIRGEKSPSWINHLAINVKGDFIQGQNFIAANDVIIPK